MRRLLAATAVALLSLVAGVSGQTCQVPPTCSSSPAVVPTAWYNLTFQSAPTAASPTWLWESSDAVDTDCQFVHRGVAKFAATSTQYIDLNAAVTAATSSGVAPLPSIIGGAGSGRAADGTLGWSFEWTTRTTLKQAGAKIFAIGAGEARWNIFAGPDGGANGEDFGVYGGNGNYANGASGIVNFANPLSTTQWYHMVAVVQNLTDSFSSDDGAAWFIYINGQLLNYTGRGVYLNSKDIQPVLRPNAYLGRSSWAADPYWTGLIDTFRIYDKALTGSQVQTLYQGEMGGCAVPVQSGTINNVNPVPNILPRIATGTVAPIYSLTFDTNPCTVGTGCSYGWEQTSPTDSSTLQQVHRGMLTLDGEAQWADLNAISGRFAVSSTALPQLGGVPSTSFPGWSFEFTMKLGGQENWGKIIDFGATRPSQTTCNNDIVLGWTSNNLQFQFDVCDANGREYQTGDAMGTLTPGAWYHLVVVAQPVIPANGLANYFTYVNGDLYTAEANYPMIAAVPRQNAWFGRSGWQGGDSNFSAEIDAFNVYNVALGDLQVSALAAAALGGSGPSVPSTCSAAITCSASPAVVPVAWYNLTFSQQVAGATGYGWVDSDAGDAGCPFVHRGVATFGGGAASAGGNYANLNNATGPYGVGTPLPSIIGGQGSGRSADGTLGWSFEWTFRSGVQAGNAKLFSIGAGEARWNIFSGPDGGAVGADFGVYGGNGNYANGASGIINYLNPVVTTRWYHVVAVVQNLTDSFNSDDGAAWFMWINGNLVNYTGRGIYLNSKDVQPVLRPMAYLGRSSWAADPYWTGVIDTFRIYDKALTGSQVQTLYQGEMGGCAVPTQTGTINNVNPVPNILPRIATGPVTPIYSLTFDTNPCTSGAGCSYGWEQTSPTDSSTLQQVHRGMLTLNGEAQWADLGATSGPFSVSTTALPQLGGVPSTSFPGWSFEFTMKLGGQENWGKIIDFGATRPSQTTCNNDIVLGWSSNNFQFQFDVCDANGREYQTGDAMGTLTPGAWYHMVVVAQPVIPANGLANYFTYVNGDLYTAEANYPMIAGVPRQNAWFGRSGWQGGDSNFSAEIDSFNIYNVALGDLQVTALSAAALGGSGPSVPSTCGAAITCSASPAVVPVAWYNLTFSQQVAGATGYGWSASDAGDAGCPFVHRGLATFSGGAASAGGNYVNLNQANGVNGAGTALPPIIGGQGSGRSADGTLGWSFEWTFRSGVQAGNAKVFSIGAGEARWNIFSGPDGGAVGADFGVYGGAGNYANGASGIINYLNPVVTTRWYHVVAVVQNLTDSFNSDDGAAWFIWVNGNLLNYTGRGIYLNSKDIQPVARTMAYLGRSSWAADPYWTGLIDTFRIYDKALTGSQVQSLYQGEMGGCFVPTQSGTISNVVAAPNILPRTATGPVAPIYSLDFGSNPCPAGGCNYVWEAVSPADDSNQQALHKGILRLNMDGNNQQFADLAATSGRFSVSSTTFPKIGGVPSTSVPGWSFELVLKPAGIVNWGKVFDIGAVRSGQTTCNNDVVLGWDAMNSQWQFDVCDRSGREYQTGDAFGNIAPGTWYHMVVVAQPVLPANGLANYFTYLNGDLYTAEANYPMIADVDRAMAWLGRSGWQGGDANWTGEIDLFAVYNVALSDLQVSEKAAASVKFTTCTAKPSCSANSATVPTPFYALDFRTNPVATAANPTYTWVNAVNTDTGCAFAHQGVATFKGGPNTGGEYVDLNAATGPSTGGAAIGRNIGGLGTGSLADGTQGWSFEMTFLSGPQQAYAKIWAMGAGEARWNIFAGPDSSGSGAEFGVYDGDGTYTNGASGIVRFVNPTVTSQWYHVVAVVQHVSTNISSNEGCAYWIYVNGNLLNFTGVAINLNSHTIQEKTRQIAYLARSAWAADPYWAGAIDTFRIYDRALTQAQVTSLYQEQMGGCTISFSSNVGSVSTPPNILPRTNDAFVAPFYSLNFATDPRDLTSGIQYKFGWQNTSSGDDNSLRALHRGMVTLDGEAQWIDMGATSGPTSASRTALPTIGGGDAGWTFEIIMKPGATENWGKLIDIGSERGSNPGACKNDIAMGWAASNLQWQFLTCDDAGHEHQTGDAFGNIQAGTWYHLVTVITPRSSQLANYFTYVNGVLYTVESNFLYPQAVRRENAWLGRSNWVGNNDNNISVELDQFNIYNTAVSDVQVTKLYQQNFLGQTVQWGTGTNGGGDTSASSSKSLSGGAIAGIVIGSVVGALVLIVLCWMFVGCGRGAKKESKSDYSSQRDDSQMRSSHRGTDEGEGETAHHDVEMA